jgi:hypothetical protein
MIRHFHVRASTSNVFSAMNQKFKSSLAMDEDSSELEIHHQNQHNNPFTSGYTPFSDFITEKVSEEVVSAVVSDATYRVKELIQVFICDKIYKKVSKNLSNP